MAATLHPPRNEPGPSLYSRALISDLDFNDNRYPSLTSPSPMVYGPADRSAWDNSDLSRRTYELSNAAVSAWAPEQPTQQYLQPRSVGASADVQSLKSQTSQQTQSQEPQRSTLSYALPPGAARRVVERYSLGDNDRRASSRSSTDTRATAVNPLNPLNDDAQPLPAKLPEDRAISPMPSTTPRHPAIPAVGVDTSNVTPTRASPPIIPLSASPSYNPPIASKHRAFPQQPTYVTPPATPVPINTVFTPKQPVQQEEICVECAMRDQDMADVDVTSPGVWERDSDAAFEDLKRRELEDEAKGVLTLDDSTRPRPKGGRLTEQNLKLWLSVNPREPASRQQTLNTYLKSQRTLLEAEALAHARAMQEAKQLDNRMRDTYSQLRRSAYDLGNIAIAADDAGGVRIRPPLSPSSPNLSSHTRSHSREITLLKNGMIVEHVDVRKEEREAKERKKKEERRARKSSRSSMMDVTSIISGQSLGPPLTDSGIGLKPYSRYSQASSLRPTSIITAPHERPDLPHAYSQASFSDVQSLGSASPRRSRFFGMKNLSAGWRSQDSLAPSGISGVSGSMLDMHVALQRESHAQQSPQSTIGLNTPRRSQMWPAMVTSTGAHDPHSEEKPKKKKNGLVKIWQVVIGSKKHEPIASGEASQSSERTDDDLPLAPPPPLSYLVNRGPSDLRPTSNRHASAPSLPSMSLKLGLPNPSVLPASSGPPSILQSPALRPAAPDLGMTDVTARNQDDEKQCLEDTVSNSVGTRNIHPVISEPDMRQHASQNVSPPPPVPSPHPSSKPRPLPIAMREKSLPPLPGEPGSRSLTTVMDPRPRTVYTYDPRQLPPGSSPPHDFLPPSAPFRSPDIRRQSFGGMSSRPNLAMQTIPLPSDSRKSFGLRYDEFGVSRGSLSRLEHVQEHPPVPRIRVASMKRKSKFGFSALLGKKSTPPEPEYIDEGFMRRSGSDMQDDLMTNGYTISVSRHSAGQHTRMSVTSRKALEERVAQDPEFVAYRYPSNNQRLDLLR